MKAATRFLFAVAFLAAAAAQAQPGSEPAKPVDPNAKPSWEFAATGYWNDLREGDSYASGIFTADRGALHLEGRVNYEAVHARSLFVGWTFSGGAEEGLSFDLRPIIGGVSGAVRGPIAGFEASLAAGRFDFYVEAEYVRDQGDKEASYTYAWSELGFKPMEALRLGLVGQRTKVYGGDREFQRGGFVQFTWKQATLGVYWFNPGSSDQVVNTALGITF